MTDSERALLLWLAKIIVLSLDEVGQHHAGDRGTALIAAVQREGERADVERGR
jgi:hypothetical protein